jgi:hypothetical protein
MEVRGGAYPLHAIWRTATPPGAAAAWMIQKVVDQGAINYRMPRPNVKEQLI